MDRIDAKLYLNLIRGGAARLGLHRQEINDLNVFPIPDGDTGDNMFMTIQAGCNPSTSSGTGLTLPEVAKAVSAGMLMGARGNSGVILSRMFAGLAKGLADVREADADAFSRAMLAGVEESYHAVSEPVEGTILTVFREGAQAAAGSKDLDEYFDLLISAMDLSLQHTPELLDVLKKAGVVDSGGAGLLYIAEGMRAALHGETAEVLDEAVPAAQHVDLDAFTEDSVLEFGYCTEFLLRLQRSKVDLDTFDETVISDWLAQNGESLVFFRDGSIIKVHVHTHTPGEILNHCQQYGEFLTIKVENMTLQHHENHMDERFKKGRKAFGVVAVASGAGLVDTFKELGADIVIEGGQTMNPPVKRFILRPREPGHGSGRRRRHRGRARRSRRRGGDGPGVPRHPRQRKRPRGRIRGHRRQGNPRLGPGAGGSPPRPGRSHGRRLPRRHPRLRRRRRHPVGKGPGSAGEAVPPRRSHPPVRRPAGLRVYPGPFLIH